MEGTDPREMAVRFGALHRRWDGAVPLDDLLPYQAWYRSVAPHARRTFRLRAMALVLGPTGMRNPEVARHVARAIGEWFPVP